MALFKDLEAEIKGKTFEYVRHLIIWHCEHETPRQTIRDMIGYIDKLEAEIKALKSEQKDTV